MMEILLQPGREKQGLKLGVKRRDDGQRNSRGRKTYDWMLADGLPRFSFSGVTDLR